MMNKSTFGSMAFISADSRMNHLLHTTDWSASALGDCSNWPELLCPYVRMLLVSPQPMVILWGPEYSVIYNDACADTFVQNPGSFGKPAASVWPHCWAELEPQIKAATEVFTDAEKSITVSDGNRTNQYQFSLTPILDERGVTRGVLCIGNKNVSPNTEPDEPQLGLQMKKLFLHAPIAMCILRGSAFIVETVNANMLALWGKKLSEVLNQSIFTGVPDAAGQGFEEMLTQVMTDGKPIVAHEMPIEIFRHGVPTQIYIKFVFEPIREGDDSISGVMVIADDVSDQVEARKRIEISDTRHKIAMETASLGTFERDLTTEDFHYSDRLAQIFGMSGNRTLTHRDLAALIHPDDLHIREQALQQASEHGVLFYEVRIIWPDKSLHWIRLNGRVLSTNSQEANKIVGTVLDITDQKIHSYILEKKVEDRTRTLKQMNAELKASEERYHRMTDEIQDYAILLLDTAGNIQNWNKGAESIKGYSESEALGSNFSMFYLPQDRESKLPQRLIHEATVNGRALNEGYRVRKDGSVFWASVAITALHDDNNNIIGFSKVTRDLTERKIAEDKMKQYNAELEFQNKELEQFAYVTSHDLQEPLRKIQMFTDLLYKNINNKDAVNKYFGKINNSASRMVELIKSVLHYSKLSQSDSEFVETNLDAICNNVLTDYELLIDEKKAVIVRDSLPTITAIPLQINQLLSNLIGNALKFTENQPEIRITHQILSRNTIPFSNSLQPGEYLELIVQDNGIGFEQQYVTQIFTVFQRLHERAAYSGTGIGLALCKKIVENHHGMITAASSPGQGATFYIYLPMTSRDE